MFETELTISEKSVLVASPKACAVADTWQAVKNHDAPSATQFISTPDGDVDNYLTEPLELALNTLELATRDSPLRKVKPREDSDR